MYVVRAKPYFLHCLKNVRSSGLKTMPLLCGGCYCVACRG